MSKQCNNCTKCCEGHLIGKVKGHDFYPGKQCFFLNIDVGCSIYKDRPKSPCKSFDCFWIQNTNMPNNFKPNNINVIQIEKTLYFLNNNKINTLKYIELIQAGKVDQDKLNNLIMWLSGKKYNIYGIINDIIISSGSDLFIKEMNI